jgi:HKD family nuclease
MRVYIFLSLMVLVFSGCANKEIKKEVNQEVAATPTLQSESELYSAENKMLLENKNLTHTQRHDLRMLMQKTKNQNIAIDNEIMKTKSVLFQNLIDKDKNKVRLGILENRLLSLNRKKTRYSLNAYREAKNIVGKSNVPLEKTLKMIDNRTINNL